MSNECYDNCTESYRLQVHLQQRTKPKRFDVQNGKAETQHPRNLYYGCSSLRAIPKSVPVNPTLSISDILYRNEINMLK